MVLLSGKEVAEKIKTQLKSKVEELTKSGKTPGLVIVQVGEDAASSVYVRNKTKSCEFVGIEHVTINLPVETTQKELVDIISCLNETDADGILVQLPLPPHIDERAVLNKIDASKDVDGFHVENTGRLILGNECIAPCTPAGIIKILDHYGVDVAGKECVIVGRSNIVGKPMAAMLLQRDGTVTVCHSKTQNLPEVCRRADILVCAIGRPKFFTQDYIKPGAVVIDVGIHRQADGKICGDVDFDDVKDVVSAITPVPGGVGVMTVAMLMENCVKIASREV